jgi:integrase
MARQVEGPWFRESKGTWYATVQGKSVSLRVRGENNKQQAVDAWHRLMANGSPGPARSNAPAPAETDKAEAVAPAVFNTAKVSAPAPAPIVQAVVDAFLTDAEARVTRGCHRNYVLFLTPFAQQFGQRLADSLTPSEVEAFARQPRKPAWSSTYQANCLAAITTAFRFALRERVIPTNPIPRLTRPPKRSRGASAVITPAEFRKLLAHADPLMRDYLTVLWHTGARPGEVASLTAEQVTAAKDGMLLLEQHKTAHKGHARLVVLAGAALSAVKARAKAVGTGLLFPGEQGQQLTAQAIGSRMRTICARAGLRRCVAYAFRHTYATQALANGVADATVAALLGHSSTAMLFKHYSHLTAQAKVMRDAAARVRG